MTVVMVTITGLVACSWPFSCDSPLFPSKEDFGDYRKVWALKCPGHVVAGTGGHKTWLPGGSHGYLPPVRPKMLKLPTLHGCDCRGQNLGGLGIDPKEVGTKVLNWPDAIAALDQLATEPEPKS